MTTGRRTGGPADGVGAPADAVGGPADRRTGGPQGPRKEAAIPTDAPTAGPPVRPSAASPSALPSVGRILAIDLGEKRIGLAISDPSRTIAQPLATLSRRAGKRFPLRQLRTHIEEHRPAGLLIGLPLEADGSEGPAARAARETGAAIAGKTGLPFAFRDERMTTARVLTTVREMGGRIRGRRGEVDALAAALLLQAYLDRPDA